MPNSIYWDSPKSFMIWQDSLVVLWVESMNEDMQHLFHHLQHRLVTYVTSLWSWSFRSNVTFIMVFDFMCYSVTSLWSCSSCLSLVFRFSTSLLSASSFAMSSLHLLHIHASINISYFTQVINFSMRIPQYKSTYSKYQFAFIILHDMQKSNITDYNADV